MTATGSQVAVSPRTEDPSPLEALTKPPGARAAPLPAPSRRIARLWVLLSPLLLFCGLVGCSKPTTGPRFSPGEGLDPLILIGKGAADDSPTWSHDGQWIAYRRRFASRDGAAGVYVISRWGGKPRFVTPGNFSGPAELDFSPDDRQLVGSWGNQLVLIDVATGSLRWPTYTANGAGAPDWSPDGRQILYRRLFWDVGTPQDSAGFHVFEPITGADHAIRAGGQVLWGWHPTWSTDGRSIVFIGTATLATTITDLRLVDSSLVTLATSAQGTLYEDLRWYSRPDAGIEGMLFQVVGIRPQKTLLLNAGGEKLLPWPFVLGPVDAVSRDGRTLVLLRPQPTDSVAVLFTRSVDDFSGVTRRQLTTWNP